MSTVKSEEIYNIPPKSTTINKLTIVSTPAGIPPMEKHLPAMTWAGEEDSEVGAIERTGTVFTSVMNLAACAFGASMLSLPYAMYIGGPFVVLLVLFAFAIAAFVSGQAIIEAGIRAKKSSYVDIVQHAFGVPASIVAEVLLTVALLVAGISYIVGLSEILPSLVPYSGLIGRDARSTSTRHA
jgi:amino acid permease